ncbi:outer membrane lipoprotein Omp10 [Neorhizobium tomejilense]|uniref:outer membrane lipoprotein Omp10 n=1 Tax=Neorhizobium tomejilense TaxID=2093828 RepID=UPI000CF88593|nr:outer membrane lipoprotein Omp10 [Neorhizobium tomejilense]
MKFKVSFALIAAASLTACVSSPPPQQMAAVQQQGVEGSWVDPNGIVSSFQAGTFNTRSSDSNTLLASGTYTSLSPTLVEINMTSLVRKTQSRVNCSLVSINQLNCTQDSGAQFSLSRRG